MSFLTDYEPVGPSHHASESSQPVLMHPEASSGSTATVAFDVEMGKPAALDRKHLELRFDESQ